MLIEVAKALDSKNHGKSSELASNIKLRDEIGSRGEVLENNAAVAAASENNTNIYFYKVKKHDTVAMMVAKENREFVVLKDSYIIPATVHKKPNEESLKDSIAI